MNLLSIVVPVCNESDNLRVLHERLTAVLAAVRIPYEILLVDDGSTDDSPAIARELHQRDAAVKILSFSRNFGQQSAIAAGLRHSRGDAVIVMDADLQDPPETIPAFIDTYEKGYDIVYGIRKKRKEHLFRRFVYKLFYRLLRFMSSVPLPIDSGDFCIMSRRAADLLNDLPERNRYIRGLRAWIGLRQIGLPYERDRRCKGTTKYTYAKMFRIAFDGIVTFSRLPFQMFLMLGSALVVLAGLACTWLLVISTGASFNAWLLAAVALFSGLQFIGLGLLGEALWHVIHETKARPDYIIKETIGLHEKR